MEIKEFDAVILKDGKEGTIIECSKNNDYFLFEYETKKGYEQIDINLDDIERVL